MSRRGEKGIAVLLSLLALAVAAFAVYIAWVCPGNAPRLLGKSPSPEDTAAAFLDALCAGDYETARSYLQDSPSLGLDTLPETEPARTLTEHFRRSWSWSAGQIWQKDAEARLPVEFTALNLTRLTDGLDREVQGILALQLDQAQREEELYNPDGSWREEAVMAALDSALHDRLRRSGEYTASTRLTLLLRYEQQRWVVVPDEMLYAVLAGEVGP